MCGIEEGSINNLFFICKIVWLIWGMCFNWLGMSTVNHYDIKSHFMHFLNDTSNRIWGSI